MLGKGKGNVHELKTLLSPRESEIIDLAARGLTDKEMSHRLGIGIGTVNTYWTRIRGKLGTSSRAEAIAFVERTRASYSLDLKNKENLLLAAEVQARREAELNLTKTQRLLKEANARLEARVEARTRELQETMRALQAEVERRRLVEERLNNAQRIARIASWEINVQTRESFWSQHLYEIYGVTPEEFPLTEESFRRRLSPERLALLDQPHPLEAGLDGDGLWAFRLIRASVMTFVDPEFWEKVLFEIRSLFDQPRVTEYDLRVLRPGRPYVHAYGVRQSEFDDSGRLKILRGVLVDTTATFEATQTMRGAERLIQIVLQNSAVGLVVLDAHGRIRFLGGRALEGLDIPAAGDRFLLDAFGGQHKSVEIFYRAMQGETVVDTISLRDRHFLQVSIPDAVESGAVVGVICVLTDITEKLQTKLELALASARYEALAGLLDHLVVTMTPDFIMTKVNEALRVAAEPYFGPLVGRHALQFLQPEDSDRIERCLRGLTKDDPSTVWVTVTTLPDGRTLTVEWRTTAIFGDDGALLQYQSVGHAVEEPMKDDENILRVRAPETSPWPPA